MTQQQQCKEAKDILEGYVRSLQYYIGAKKKYQRELDSGYRGTAWFSARMAEANCKIREIKTMISKYKEIVETCNEITEDQCYQMAKEYVSRHGKGEVECTWNVGNQLFHVYVIDHFKVPTGDGGWYWESDISSFSQITFKEMVRELE